MIPLTGFILPLKRFLFAGTFFILAPAILPAAVTPDIQVDQTGYLPTETKLAMISNASATGTFTVRQVSGGATVFNGTLSASAVDSNSGLTLRNADFSAVTATGNYCLDVAGLGQSYYFTIDPATFSNAFYETMRFYTGQRCGTGVTIVNAGTTWTHAACHTADGTFDPSSGKSGTKAATEGWHDAGDYGKYVVNSGISTGELLWTYEWYANRIGGMNLNIPESGNGTPDILNEIRWNLEWLLTMQDADGGVWHKLTTAAFDPFEMPEFDSAGTRLIIGNNATPFKTTAASADFGAVMAIASRLFQPYDATFSTTCLNAAVSAWGWVQLNPNVTFTANPPGISTGTYGDGTVTDEILWASAELFRATGGAAYNTYFMGHYTNWAPTVNGNAYPQDWSNLHQLAMWTYYFSGQASASAAARTTIKTDTINAANAIVARQNADGYRVSLRTADYIWGSNGGVGNFGILLLMANAMTPTASYVQATLDDIHYLLGRNGNKISFVTDLGTTFQMHPHHRPSGADGITLPWPGMLAGGPNQNASGDGITPTSPGTKPALCYADIQGAYGSNEEAINWNAPLVFILASTLPTPGGTRTPTPTNTFFFTPTPTSTSTPTLTPTKTASNSPTLTSTNTLSPTVTSSATPSPTRTPSNTLTLTFTISATQTPTNTPTSTATKTPTSTATASPSFTPTNRPSSSPTKTPTITPTSTATSSPTNTITLTFTLTPTGTLSPTNSFTPTNSPTKTTTNSPTDSPSSTATSTPTSSPTPSFTVTATMSPTNSSTSTVTSVNTATATPTSSSTSSPTKTLTLTVTMTPTASSTSSPTATVTITSTVTLANTSTMTAIAGYSGPVTFSPPYPNPSKDGSPINVDIGLPGPASMDWAVFTTAFRKINSGTLSLSGSGTFQWDLRDKTGAQAAMGLYYIRLEVSGDFGKVKKILKVLVL